MPANKERHTGSDAATHSQRQDMTEEQPLLNQRFKPQIDSHEAGKRSFEKANKTTSDTLASLCLQKGINHQIAPSTDNPVR
ncbi:MAG TPA: hypothetical protein DCS30_10220 [Rhizobiales bacterium]|nr:hypothetical protein [Hyphomicrobiales bacterium]